MKLSRPGLVLAFIIALAAACKFPELPAVVDASEGDDAATSDASPDDGAATDGAATDATSLDGPTVNALGQVCDPAVTPTTCPDGNLCMQVQKPGGGGVLDGWCSPNCMNDNARCTTGYTGPASGMPMCALTAGQATPEYCLISCQNNADCPSGLTCQTIGNPPQGSICARP